MNNVKLVQTQLSALQDKVVDTVTIGEFATEGLARDFLVKRGYTFDSARGAWINGNTTQFPVTIETKEADIFDIGSFI